MDLDHVPLGPPTPPQVSNFVNPATFAPTIVAISTICLAIMIPFAIIRMYSKAWIVKALWWDDWTCLLAIIGSIAYTAVVLASMSVTGVHTWDVPISAFTPEIFRRQILVYEMSWSPTLCFTKLSLLLLYLRIFSPNRGTRYAIYLGIVVNVLFYAACTVIFGALCIPRHGQTWLETAQTARCRKSIHMEYPTGIFGVISDLYILILPMPTVFNLHLPMKRRIGVAAIFMTGAMACVTSIIGLWLRVKDDKSTDFTYTLGETVIAAIAETNIGVVCSCAPSLAIFFRHHPVNISWILSYKTLRAKLSKGSSHPEGFDRVGSLNTKDIRLETQILGSSAKAEGKIIGSSALGWRNAHLQSTSEAWAG